MRLRASTLLCALSCALLAGCAAVALPPRRFPLRLPLVRDPDTQPFATAPAVYESPLIWDAIDQSAFVPALRALALEPAREAVNVNALDEVPDSSWYENRLARRAMTPDELAQGACNGAAPLDDRAVWVVTAAKPDGWSPGFIARGPDGARYLLKADGDAQGVQPTAADVIGARLYWAAGYLAPCNRVVHVRAESLTLAPDATARLPGGRTRPLTREDLAPILSRAFHTADGALRFGASRFVDGRPLGPWTYSGVRDDDPNDAVPHEDRRDVRAARLLAAWLGHFDAREQNTLATFVAAAPGRAGGYVRHYLIDFADCLGGIWPNDALSRRMGHSYYADVPQIAADLFTLGLLDRSWDRAAVDPDAWPFGYFSARDFDPSQWRAGYPNPAFDRMTERDGAWMARILARITDAHLRAVVREARLPVGAWEGALVRTLAARRDAILQRYLLARSPLTDFTVEDRAWLCSDDRAVDAGLSVRASYSARFRDDPGALGVEARGPRVCVALGAHAAPDGVLPLDDARRYRVLEWQRDRTRVRVHLYDLGPARGWAVAGVER